MLFDFDKIEKLSTEAISFQNKSKLGKELEGLFQDVIDYREHYLQDNNNEYNDELISNVYKYIKTSGFKEKFIKIVKNNIGIEIEKLHLYMNIDHGVFGQFACNISHEDINNALGKETFNLRINSATGIDDVLTNKNYNAIDNVLEYIDVGEQFNTQTSKVLNTTYGDGKVLTIKSMHFDVNTAFLSDYWTLRLAKKVITDPKLLSVGINTNKMTASNLVAIMLHEIGHILLLVERMVDLTHQHIRLNSIVEYDRKYGDTKKQLQSALNNKDRIKKQINTKLGGKGTVLLKTYDILNNAGEVLLDLANKNENAQNSQEGLLDIPKVIGASLIHLITSLYTVVFYIIIRILFCFAIICDLIDVITVMEDPTNTNKKTSDTNVNRQNYFLMEREADNFAIRHGYGADLIEGLRKLTLIVVNSDDKFLGNKVIQNSILYNLISTTYIYIISNLKLSGLEIFIYENDILFGEIVRHDRIIENMMAAFKMSDMPNDMREEYINNVKKAKISREQAAKQNKLFGPLNIANIILTLTYVPTTKFLSMLHSGHLNQDYVKLQNQLDSIMNNELFYQSARIKQIQNNKK
jgi:hypothetical protein